MNGDDLLGVDLKYYAKYPFLEGAALVLKEKGIKIEDLLTDLAFEPARTRGMDRVRQAVESGEVSAVALARDADQLIEVLSYPIARMIVSCSGHRLLIARYALAEAVLLEKRLQNESDDNLLSIARELGIDARSDSRGFQIHFSSFLANTSTIRAKEWKLVNQEIFRGMVMVDRDRLTRIARQALNDKINSELPRPVNEKILSVFGEVAQGLVLQLEGKRKEFVAGELGPIDDSSFPPCMKTILTMMRNGENVPHTARFAITSFLGTLGMSSDKIMEMFSSAPDFDPSKSEYQIHHILGDISGTKYTPPECATMKSYGNCYDPDSLCEKEWMTHPLKYYRAMRRRRGSRGSKRPPSPRESLKNRDDSEDDEQQQHQVED
ncbi:MAG: DNA primase large subunit PriL [Thermoplasmata archaeon]